MHDHDKIRTVYADGHAEINPVMTREIERNGRRYEQFSNGVEREIRPQEQYFGREDGSPVPWDYSIDTATYHNVDVGRAVDGQDGWVTHHCPGDCARRNLPSGSLGHCSGRDVEEDREP